jgi:hypothetical protein
VHFLYPSDPLRTKKCDEMYADEFAAVKAVGLEGSFFSLEEFQGGSFRPSLPLPAEMTIIYRGWMLSVAEYEALVVAIIQSGARPLTDVKHIFQRTICPIGIH